MAANAASALNAARIHSDISSLRQQAAYEVAGLRQEAAMNTQMSTAGLQKDLVVMSERMRSLEQQAETSKRDMVELRRAYAEKAKELDRQVFAERGTLVSTQEGLKAPVDHLESTMALTTQTQMRQEVQRECAGYEQQREKLGRTLARVDALEAANTQAKNLEGVLRDLSTEVTAGGAEGGGETTARLMEEITRLGVGLAQIPRCLPRMLHGWGEGGRFSLQLQESVSKSA
ncbi:hypothetical protein ABB37_03632 [Leptomonas pyrrhocoris]|uniref:Uncharacterized protein n=1 Tax=Leptomonas pyrrhocoris TaxID=157538 RepID=A0A0M9G355_LEPPY|nr:hypothetical protein ABB37_03632 [Leptomonas pyrrhocoris]KPA81209.1 hypothetical protein ABB37_03632 [Leptomonas pyrrhocoris]|eukprot:XP_015659648.1 hypothetical protein ABB37_03632 [Leptomonas pyrrhocoris]